MAPIISNIIFLMCATLLTQVEVAAYPYGAPDTACDSMRPMHYTTKKNMSTPLIEPSSRGSSYFNISVNTTGVDPGDHVAVTIMAKDNYYIEGFLLQARSDATGTTRHGTFMDPSRDGKLACGKAAVTHITNNQKSSVTVIWMAPMTAVDNKIQFHATIVKGYSEFYMHVTSVTMSSVGSGVSLVPSMIIVFLMVLSALS